MHLESIERQTGKRPAELDGPECPEALAHLWEYFCELSAARGAGMAGIEPLHYGEIEAWSRLSRRELGFFELECLVAVDHKFREINQPPKPKKS